MLLKSASKIIHDTLSTLSLGLGKQMIKLASAEMTKTKVQHVYTVDKRGQLLPALTDLVCTITIIIVLLCIPLAPCYTYVSFQLVNILELSSTGAMCRNTCITPC